MDFVYRDKIIYRRIRLIDRNSLWVLKVYYFYRFKRLKLCFFGWCNFYILEIEYCSGFDNSGEIKLDK